LEGVSRASIHYYNTEDEIDILVDKVEQIFEYAMSANV
jgi:selenocysteine lyase/cysteine desulfurase